jgi:hypothetical protein
MAAHSEPKRTSRGLTAVGDLLPGLAERGGWGALVEMSRLQARWPEVVGEMVAAHTAPERIARGRLTVRVDSSAWLMQLSFFKADIHRKVNAFLGEERVQEVFLQVGRTRPEAASRRRVPEVPVAPEAARVVEEELRAVPDPAVRDALRSLRLRDLRTGRRPRKGR